MQTENTKTMTQDELVEGLHLLGYPDASVTRVAAWRKWDLLPEFTSAGQGQGRGAGRVKGHWSDPEAVLKQAISIIELLIATGASKNYISLCGNWVMPFLWGACASLSRNRC